MYGYGAYGITYDPLVPFSPPLRLGWIEHGGVIVVAHVRGGGEYGEEWYRGGYKLTKAEHLATISPSRARSIWVKQKYTSARANSAERRAAPVAS